jgi:hypothetical protein
MNNREAAVRRINNRVILIKGAEAVRRYLCVRERGKDSLKLIRDSIEIYKFDTEEEAEAFRMGLCAVCEDAADDFCEMSEQGYKNFIALLRETFQKVAV